MQIMAAHFQMVGRNFDLQVTHRHTQQNGHHPLYKQRKDFFYEIKIIIKSDWLLVVLPAILGQDPLL